MSREAVHALERLRLVADDAEVPQAVVKQALLEFLSHVDGVGFDDVTVPERAVMVAIKEVQANAIDFLG